MGSHLFDWARHMLIEQKLLQPAHLVRCKSIKTILALEIEIEQTPASTMRCNPLLNVFGNLIRLAHFRRVPVTLDDPLV